ncbi:hypothetical protein SDC9_57794 [bioreactor metagenome]|uniref:Uncharacterized protein n=1 Tax=bioreactor metagenome TaxID=1076179 RepID=A0A644X5K2_9ZZZZ
MQVHIIKYHWCNVNEEGSDIIGVYFDYDKAVKMMKEFAASGKEGAQFDFGPHDWEPDFDQDGERYISCGWYGGCCDMDSTWSLELITMEVE